MTFTIRQLRNSEPTVRKLLMCSNQPAGILQNDDPVSRDWRF
jgi:hypothetical protein